MRLIQVLAIVLTEFSVGTLLFASLLSGREIRSSFFTLNSLLAALASALALVLTKVSSRLGWWDERLLGLTVIGATFAFGCFRLEKPMAGRLLLMLAGFLGLFFGLLPLAERVLVTRGLSTTTPALFHATIISGALLLGATSVTMILGHWYLIMPRLSFEYLLRFVHFLLAAVGLRLLAVVGNLALLRSFDAKLADALLPPLLSVNGNLAFFALRLVLGVGVPGVLGLMVLRCLERQANQAATGLLYVAVISVLFGELFAAYLLI